ncbi:hypothetical protein CRE_23917 [Caenorhabditis remanei]|uniref:Chromo domain-containing protein n=1 Tax=Caenorhabditis remanei TaxID=31234 RepID=E3MGG1_CAERE|nr:hypothetical protein CRE_23917 [Caenorhabditis remanei]
MAKKPTRLTKKRKRSSCAPKQNEQEIADTNVYEVESICGQSIQGNTIQYEVKWKGYSEDENTSEPEFRLNCDDKIVNYVTDLIDCTNYIEKIPKSIEALDKLKANKKAILEDIAPIAYLAQTTVHGGVVKFAIVDTISNILKYSRYIISSDQLYAMYAAYVPNDEKNENVGNVRKDMEQWQMELDRLQIHFADYPKLKIQVPDTIRSVFYLPPPLSHLLFEPVTEETFEKRKVRMYHFPPKANQLSFHGIQMFIKPSHLDALEQNKFERAKETDRLDFRKSPRFRVPMKLSQHYARGYILTLGEDVEQNTPLMLMAGVIRPQAVANQCLKNDGERVAFSSFIEIPNSNMCLDRREFHDFSKYIPHSCEPTCGVRLVNSGAEFPDLVVYSLHAIDASYSHAITLDYYKMFQKDVKQYFNKNKPSSGKIFSLYDQGIDFLHCQCFMEKCPEVLYIARSKEECTPPLKKKAKTAKNQESLDFGGLKLADSDNTYMIIDGEFEE